MSLLNQTCPHCRITEAAGGHCTSCERPTQPDWVHRKRLSEAQVANPCHYRARAALYASQIAACSP